MVRKGDTFKDLRAYISFRIEHLSLEAQKVRFTTKPELRNTVYQKLNSKIKELKKTMLVINGDIKENSKFEYKKAQYLTEKKIEMLKKIKKETYF